MKALRELQSDFPAQDVGPGHAVYRAHRFDNGPLYYCTNGLCRFDPPDRSKGDYGTCCTADAEVIALLEHLGDQDFTWEWVAKRRISEIVPRKKHRIADLLDPTTVGRWRIGGDLQAGRDRPQSKSWGAAFRKAGFDGVRHKSAKDVALDEVCVAFFGPPGPHSGLLKHGDPAPVSRRVLRELEQRFGFRSFPRAPLP
ncbi:RES domain-containing protein [Streptomyces bottropensis]|uniref:RES domain-containing protein n=1 Tax=Streptomyces bottropensis TaxID=42235 RepID=UPI003698A964